MVAPELFNVAVVPLITGLVEAVKRAGLPERHAALVSLGFGLVLSLGAHLATANEGSLYHAALEGLVAGLTASGLYSVARAVTSDEGQSRPRAAGRARRDA